MEWTRDPKLYPPYLRPRIRQGRGVGYGLGYKRWLNIRDVSSQGTSSSVRGIRVARPYHMLSELETIYFFLTERQSSVVDIREQGFVALAERLSRSGRLQRRTLTIRYAQLQRNAFPD